MSHVWNAMNKHRREEEDEAAAEAKGEGAASTPASSSEGPSDDKQSPASQDAIPAEATAAEPGQAAASPAAATSVAPREMPAAAKLAVTNNYSPVLVAHHDRGGPISEQFRALRTHLLAHFEDRNFSLTVTSSDAGEGKTVSTLNLGVVLAERAERRTVCIDMDLRRGKFGSYLNMEKSPGMGELLRGEVSLDDVLRPTIYPNLFVVNCGNTPQSDVGNLVGRPRLGEVAKELQRRFDYVLIDSPPINRAADAGMIGQVTDGALMVVRMNKTHRESVDRAIRLLHASGIDVVGLVLTHQKYYIPDYLYRYS